MALRKKGISLTPTFLLRGIDPIQLAEKYEEGQFSQLTLKDLQGTISTFLANKPANVQLTTALTENSDDPIYIFKLKNAMTQTIVTTNNNVYRFFTHEEIHDSKTEESPKFGSSPSNNKMSTGFFPHLGQIRNGTVPEDTLVNCWWCHQSIQLQSGCIGIPVSISTISNKRTSSNNEKSITVFHMDGCYCSFECALASLYESQKVSANFRDYQRSSSVSMLNLLFSMMYPDKVLRPALSYKLLDSFGGPYSIETWKQATYGTSTYIPISNIIVAPIKRQYLKINNSISNKL